MVKKEAIKQLHIIKTYAFNKRIIALSKIA